ncbi:MAG TPA: TFIIB-type zinc ribbon-containing protein [Patescibacteria group bacterium]|nr:TFIIB-type zinc ribbon-containing protein [Patescibacteria group bacterium]
MNVNIEVKECSNCGSSNIIRDLEAGEEICGDCGLVLREAILDERPEWRAFNEAERKSRQRVGIASSLTMFDKGLSTSFNGLRDGRGKQLDLETIDRMNRLRRYDNRSKLDDTHARNLSIAMAELDRVIATLHLPDTIRKQAALTYRKALKQDLIRGRSIDAFVVASIYAACRAHRVPRSLKSIAKASTREYSEVSRTYRLLIRELDLRMPVDDPMKFVSGIASKLKLKRQAEQHAVEILREAKRRQGLSGKDPQGVAAAALYMACQTVKEKRIQKEVAAAAGTTEVTLRNRLKGLMEILGDSEIGKIEVPPDPT